MVLEKRTSTSDNIELQEIKNGENFFPVDFPNMFDSPNISIRNGNTPGISTFPRPQPQMEDHDQQHPSGSLRVGVYNQLSCDLENDDAESIKLNVNSAFPESTTEESIPLHRENETVINPNAVTNTILRCNRKRWMLWILIITLVVIVIPGVLAAIIDSSLLRHNKVQNDPSTATPYKIQNNTNSQISPGQESYDLKKEEHIANSTNRILKYTLHRQELPTNGTKTNAFSTRARQTGSPKDNRRLEFPIPDSCQPLPLPRESINEYGILQRIVDDETRQDREFWEELRLHSGKSIAVHNGTSSVENAHHDEDIQKIKVIDEVTMNEGIKFGKMELKNLYEIEERLRTSGFTLPKRSPESFHQLFKKSSNQSFQLGLTGYAMTKASVWMKESLNMSAAEARHGIVTSISLSIQPNQWCEEREHTLQTCNKVNPYRSMDGTCNNLRNPTWGSALQTYRRILMPDYADDLWTVPYDRIFVTRYQYPEQVSLKSPIFCEGITEPRIGSGGYPLPNARKVSQTIILDKQIQEKQASLIVPLWAQFIAYDLSNTVQYRRHDNFRISCCENGTLTGIQHPECFPIYIDAENKESEYFDADHRCTTFLRSASAPICHFGPREQFNEYTSFLDGSNIYGSSLNTSKYLRSTYSGKLKVFAGDDGRTLLPVDTYRENSNNSDTQRTHPCFQSGDARTNANLGLTSMHTIWTRQHNHIASILRSLNPEMTNSYLFEETRRIVVAQIQHITFNEFLPILLGPNLMQLARLELLENGYYTEYDVTVDTTLSNVFATAANRYGPSMIQGLLQFIDSKEHGTNIDYRQTHNFFFNPLPLWQDGKLDEILRGHCISPAGKVDTFFTKQVTEKMFRKDKYPYGLDIVAINIQRGRDHGIPSYTTWRNTCGLSNISSFDDLNTIWNNDVIRLVRQTYKSVHDIDLYIGGLAEVHVVGGLVGPTFGCLIADQFLRIRKGDRFWYEGDIQVQPFTPEQLRTIRQTTLARIFCENGDDLTSLQPNLFKQPTKDNKKSLCDGGSIPKIDYTLWKENDDKLNKPSVINIPYGKEDSDEDPYANIMDTNSESNEDI